ncbi:MAG: phytanoyl-CoA dioxygenase family protein [Pseudomonadota bacterium]|nr:phytanoyl-CoA dioxygenase family protein [Pseudomonadota bacterium]
MIKQKKKFEKLKYHYEKYGWVVYKKLFDFQQIQKVKIIINNYLDTQIKKNYKKTRSINFINDTIKSVDQVNSFHELAKSRQIKLLANSKKILNIASFFLNSEPEFRSCELFAKPARKGLPSPNHQDNFYWGVKGSNALTFWIALDKSTKKNGSVHYYNGTHKFGILKHDPSYAKGSSQKISDKKFLNSFKVSQPELEPGDAIIHHSLVVHGSSKNLSNRYRRGWTIQFKDKFAKYDFKQIKAYEKSLRQQIEAR